MKIISFQNKQKNNKYSKFTFKNFLKFFDLNLIEDSWVLTSDPALDLS